MGDGRCARQDYRLPQPQVHFLTLLHWVIGLLSYLPRLWRDKSSFNPRKIHAHEITSTGFRFLLMLPLSFPPLYSFDSLHFNSPYLPNCRLNSLTQGSFGSGTPFVLTNPLRRGKIPSTLY